MSEFSESNDTSTEALDSASEGTSLSDTLEWTDASPEVSDSGVFSIGETDDFTIIYTCLL